MTRLQFVGTMYITSKGLKCTLYCVLLLSDAKESKKMDSLPTNVTRVTNDTEESFTYEKDGIRTNLSILSPAGDDPACICHAQYRDGIDAPLKDETIHISHEEKELLIKLLSKSEIL